MKQLKLAVFVCFVVASFFSCKKNKNNPNTPPQKVCHGLFIALEPVSGNLVSLAKIDENGFKIDESGLPEILIDLKSSSNIQYNKKDSCLYYLSGNDITKEVYLNKCHLATKQTEKFTCTNPSYLDYIPIAWHLYYNSFTNQFYLGYFYTDIWGGYTRDMLKLTITGNTFTASSFSVPGLTLDIVAPFIIDEQTGDMYFYENYSYTSAHVIRYSPITSDTININSIWNINGFKYNPNDGQVYGYSSQKQFVRLDLKTGVSEAYGYLNTDSLTGTTFDVCNNQYIFYENWDVFKIYWVDITLGTVVKQVTIQDNYLGLIHIPQTQ